MKYSKQELEAFRTFYKKFQCLDCTECLTEADAALQVVKRYFTMNDMSLLLNEQARSRVTGRSGLKRLMLTILKRMEVDLDDLLGLPDVSNDS